MENPTKKVFSFYLDDGTMNKLDAIATAQRRNRSTQIAFLIDEAYINIKPAPPVSPVDQEEKTVTA